MQGISKYVVTVFLALFLASCAAAPVLPPEYSYGKDEIHINLDADRRLNLYEGRAHTLLLCVYQLRDPNAFNRLTGDKEGIYKLLECSRFDQSVTHSKRLIVQPGQKVQYSLDRAEGTRYVAIATGYYNINKEGILRLFEVPLRDKSGGGFGSSRVSVPDIMNIQLHLGSKEIEIGGAQ